MREIGAGTAAAPVAANCQGDVVALSSRPSSPRTILLDFDGHTTTGTHWNSDFNLTTIVSSPNDFSSWAVASTPGVFTEIVLFATVCAPVKLSTDTSGTAALHG